MMNDKREWFMEINGGYTKYVAGRKLENGTCKIESYGIFRTPWDVFENGLPLKELDLCVFLKACLKDRKKKEKLTLILKHSGVLITSFVLQTMSLTEIEKAVYWKLYEIVSSDPKEWRFDFLARERIAVFKHLGMNKKELDIIGIAVYKKILLSYKEVFKKINHRIDVIVPEFFVLEKLLKENQNKSKLLINLGVDEIYFFLFVNNFLFKVKNIKAPFLKRILLKEEEEKEIKILKHEINEILEDPLFRAKGFPYTEVFVFGDGASKLEEALFRIEEKNYFFNAFILNEEDFIFNEKVEKEELLMLITCLGGLQSQVLKGENDEA